MEHPIGHRPAPPFIFLARLTHRPGMKGITIIELMVTIAVLGVLLAVGVPSFAALTRQWQQDAAVDAFVGDVRLARSTATRTSRQVVMCAVNTAAACSGQDQWSSGWMVFSDLDNDGEHDAGEPVIAQRGPQAGVGSLAEGTNSPPLGKLRFRSNGTLANGALTVHLVPVGATESAHRIILNAIGRSRVVKNG